MKAGAQIGWNSNLRELQVTSRESPDLPAVAVPTYMLPNTLNLKTNRFRGEVPVHVHVR